MPTTIAADQTNLSFGWRPELPDHRDLPYSLRLDLERPLALPSKVDLRPFCPPVYDQGHLGSCTANAIAGAFQFDRRKQNASDFVPSRLFIYYNEREMEGTTDYDAGAYLRDGVKSVATKGVCKESDWAYEPERFRNQPAASCYENAVKYLAVTYYRLDNQRIDELRGCLAAGFPFVFGFVVYDSIRSANQRGGLIPMPGNEPVIGGHAVMAVGYDDQTEMFIIRNSWGEGQGDRGYFYMPYRYLTTRQLSDDFWTVRTVTTAARPI